MATAIVVYDSWYGCTKGVAEEVARGLSADGRVPTIVARVRSPTLANVLDHEVIVVGSPNHFGAPIAHVRQFLRELRSHDLRGKRLAFFDTCFGRDRGKAVGKMEAIIHERNPLVSLPFLVFSAVVDGVQGPLSPGALVEAREFGRSVRGSLAILA